MYPSKFFSFNNNTFMGAMGMPGGSNFIFPRLYHHTFVVAVDAFEDSTGIVMVPSKRLSDPEKLGRLWAHEIYRVFYDREQQQDLNSTKRNCVQFPKQQLIID
uniref:Uncharacterized protein n=1 Tax=Glossina brevipalpis TaxID=37001 RepID=A0A1A9WLF9_9MUSC